MSNIDRISVIEHLILISPLTMREICDHFHQMLDLPEFHFDYDNEAEWGRVEVDNIEYNIQLPKEDGTLQKWDETVPADCNFGITLILYREHPHANDNNWADQNLVTPIAQQLADRCKTNVHHHRSWYSPGTTVAKSRVYHPKLA